MGYPYCCGLLLSYRLGMVALFVGQYFSVGLFNVGLLIGRRWFMVDGDLNGWVRSLFV